MREPDHTDLLCRATRAVRRDHPGAEVRGLVRLQGGVSSLTFASTVCDDTDEQPVVVKVAPPGLAPVLNRDVLRQAAVLRRLSELDGFPVPGVLFEDAGDPPDVPPLFGMQLRPGDAYEPLLDVADDPPDAAIAAERMRVAARALARLHAQSPAALGLAGEPVQPVAEELARWERLFATVDRDIAVGHEKLADRLAAHTPTDGPPVLLHGDYRVANMLFVGAELSAVIDWEIWSVGDPRSDLAWLLMHTAPGQRFHEERPARDREAGRLLPSASELLAEYVDARRRLGATGAEIGVATADLGWFLGLCHYKTASTVAVLHKRDRKLAEPSSRLTTGARHLHRVLEAGHRALEGNDQQ